MFLFEMATLGKTILIPDLDLLKNLARNVPGVLSELSYFQINGLPTHELSDEDLNNYNSPLFFNQWLAFADFYDKTLMPNIQQFNCISQLNNVLSFKSINSEILSKRNLFVKEKRRDFVKSFIDQL
jgi:hypothetical protein